MAKSIQRVVAERIAAELTSDTQGRKVWRLVIEFVDGPALNGPGWGRAAIADLSCAEIAKSLVPRPAAGSGESGKSVSESLVGECLAWAAQTFPQATPESTAAHLAAEAIELKKNPGDPEEIADVVMLALQHAHKAGVSVERAVRAKLEKNRLRKWGKPNAEGFVEHVPEAQPPPRRPVRGAMGKGSRRRLCPNGALASIRSGG